ncbi:HAD family hydrolase [Methanobacterium sp.]|uniref:HAD family hydrolase n=1 Tax=Methanobacterium sp. TaxID=2164 RepID=UPI003C773BE0
MDKLVLFDIDKTLIDRSICHHVAFSYAFKKIYGVTVDISIINYAGMTDPQIAMEVLKCIGLDESLVKVRIDECMDAIVDYFKENAERENIPALDGAKELLDALENKVIIGLITGNLEPIALEKMRKAGLSRYFHVGGFGSDNINRTELVKTAIKRAKDNHNFNGSEVFVIGDTPRDIKAGYEAGARSIGVATGRYSKEELKDSGADFVFDSLKDKKKIVEIILQTS